MSANANALPDATATSTTAPLRTRPFFWSVKRELWENRSLYIAPLAVATLLLLAVVVSYVQGRGITISIPEATQVSPDRFRSVSLGAFAVCAGIMTVTMFFVSLFYLLDSLHGERKDRSVLFWKSLPVSDTTTVLSKLVTGAVIAPLIGLVIAFVLYMVLLLGAAAVLAGQAGLGAKVLANAEILEFPVVALYLLIVGALWYAPISGWLLFVSSWARRTPFLWAVLPPAAISIAEYLAFGTSYFRNALDDRFGAGLAHAFDPGSGIRVSETGATNVSPDISPTR